MQTVLLSIAAIIAAAVIFNLYKKRQVEQANPPVGQFMDVEGVRLHYIDKGQGEPIVLLHGNGSMIQDFIISGLVDLLASRYRVIAFDRPGYGYSKRPRGRSWNPIAQARVLRGALQQLQVTHPVVLGHSWGTMVALALALQSPAYVRSLVLMSGYYYPTLRPDVPIFSTPAIPVIGDILRYTISPILGRLMWPSLLRMIFGPAPTPQHFSEKFPVWMALRPSQLRASAAESGLMIPSAFKFQRYYQQLTMPVVIVSGANDRFVHPNRHSMRLHRELPQSVLRLIPGAGHMVHQVAPHEVSAAVDEAVGRQSNLSWRSSQEEERLDRGQAPAAAPAFAKSHSDYRIASSKVAPEHKPNIASAKEPLLTIPLAREELEVGKTKVETGIVRVRKIVHEHEEMIDQPLLREEVDVKRVSINRVVDQPVAARYEGKLLIVPVLEEKLVVQKQWILKEELHISRHTVEAGGPQSVTLRSEEAIVERDRHQPKASS
ncbi:MAG TPA: alpha/beta fold hydrolase, partial [Burkholderiales bacterium]|nr:alpha/beta fold hydrolase [Burkholderiales bacterium]